MFKNCSVVRKWTVTKINVLYIEKGDELRATEVALGSFPSRKKRVRVVVCVGEEADISSATGSCYDCTSICNC